MRSFSVNNVTEDFFSFFFLQGCQLMMVLYICKYIFIIRWYYISSKKLRSLYNVIGETFAGDLINIMFMWLRVFVFHLVTLWNFLYDFSLRFNTYTSNIYFIYWFIINSAKILTWGRVTKDIIECYRGRSFFCPTLKTFIKMSSLTHRISPNLPQPWTSSAITDPPRLFPFCLQSAWLEATYQHF